jgi:hypothetical protein
MLTGKYPEKHVLLEKFELSSEELENLLTDISLALEKRGLPPFELVFDEDEFPAEFVLACNLMTVTGDKRTTPVKLKDANLTTQQWQGFLRIPKYREYYQQMLDESFGTVLLSAKTSLARNVEAGDLASIKHVHEMTGVYRPNQETQVNLGLVIAKMMEFLASKVSPVILAELADELDSVTILKELNA